MPVLELFGSWQGWAILVVIVLVLYGARIPSHQLIRSLCRISRNGLRLMSRSALMAEERMTVRNREVLLNVGKETVERLIEREFHRVNAVVERDLGGFPVLQRSLSECISKIDEDYRTSSELVPPPPEWVKAIEGMAKLPAKGDPAVSHILKEIHKTTNHQYKTMMEKYQKAIKMHHAGLNRLMPYWRKVNHTLDDVGKTITGILGRAKVIDDKMGEYERIRTDKDEAVRALTSSSMTQFFISGLVLFIAIGGAFINFHIIALPMSEMVGAGSYLNFRIWEARVADVAALVIILVEIAMGLYLMESLRITRLFPIIGQMDDRMRYKMIWITFSILLILASIESALAFMRDQIAADRQALRQALVGSEIAESPTSWIPLAGQMIMGFVLPFALTFVAIPLESFVHSCRTVIGISLAFILRLLAFGLRLLGNIAGHMGEFLVNLYDVIVFPPLWIENMIRDIGKDTVTEETVPKREFESKPFNH